MGSIPLKSPFYSRLSETDADFNQEEDGFDLELLVLNPSPTSSLAILGRRHPALLLLIPLFLLLIVAVTYHPRTSRHGGVDLGLPSLPLEVRSNAFLTERECEREFPLLWNSIQKVRSYQIKSGGISEEMVDGAREGARVVIINGNLYVKSFTATWTWRRAHAVLGAIHDAIMTSPEPFPNVEFAFSVEDVAQPLRASFASVTPRPGEPAWLIPDFGFYSWPERVSVGYKEVLTKIDELENHLSWDDKISQLFWRGAVSSKVRDSLREVAAPHNWGNIGHVSWSQNGAGSVPMWEHCRYKYLAHAEGVNDAYSGRLKYLLNCHSVIITHELGWDQHFHPALDSDPLSPNRNIIMIPGRRWETLNQVMEELFSSPVESQRIANNAQRILHERYLTPAATACYWRGVLKAYASCLNFTVSKGDAKDYESFMLMREVNWDLS